MIALQSSSTVLSSGTSIGIKLLQLNITALLLDCHVDFRMHQMVSFYLILGKMGGHMFWKSKRRDFSSGDPGRFCIDKKPRQG